MGVKDPGNESRKRYFFRVYVENFGFEFEMKIEIAEKNAHENGPTLRGIILHAIGVCIILNTQIH